jgi:type I restriction enzyme S subunit
VTGWDSRPLDSVVALSSGSTPSKADAANWGGSIPWVSAKDMKTFYVFDSEDHLTAQGGAAARMVPPGTVLLLVRGMTLHHDVPICLTKTAVAFNQDVKALRPRDRLDSRFLAFGSSAKRRRCFGRLTPHPTVPVGSPRSCCNGSTCRYPHSTNSAR